MERLSRDRRERPTPARPRGYERCETEDLLVTALLLAGLVLAACSSGSKKSAPTSSTSAAVDCTGWSSPAPGAKPPAAGRRCAAADTCLRLNQVQVLGTHNSYHLQDPPKLLDVIKAFDKTLGESIEYTHPALPVQFSRGRAPDRARRVRRPEGRPLREAAPARGDQAADRFGHRRADQARLQGAARAGRRLQQQLPHVRRLPHRGARLVARTSNTFRSRSSSRRRTTRRSTR